MSMMENITGHRQSHEIVVTLRIMFTPQRGVRHPEIELPRLMCGGEGWATGRDVEGIAEERPL